VKLESSAELKHTIYAACLRTDFKGLSMASGEYAVIQMYICRSKTRGCKETKKKKVWLVAFGCLLAGLFCFTVHIFYSILMTHDTLKWLVFLGGEGMDLVKLQAVGERPILLPHWRCS
jgi:hypothetical protein